MKKLCLPSLTNDIFNPYVGVHMRIKTALLALATGVTLAGTAYAIEPTVLNVSIDNFHEGANATQFFVEGIGWFGIAIVSPPDTLAQAAQKIAQMNLVAETYGRHGVLSFGVTGRSVLCNKDICGRELVPEAGNFFGKEILPH